MSKSPQELLTKYYSQSISTGYSLETVNRVILNTSMYLRDMNISCTSQITTENILSWGEKKISSVSSSTLYAYYNSIRSYISFLKNIGTHVSVDESRIKCRPRYKTRVCLKPSQVKKIIKNAPPPTDTLIRLMYTTGMRVSEAVSITQEHLIGDTTIYIKSKGGHTRPVFITKELYSDLESLAAENSGSCFVNQKRKPADRGWAYRNIKKAAIRAGHPTVHCHTLRHSFATELLRQGVSLSHTQRLMGHSSVATTQVYEHLVTGDIKKAHLRLTRV